MNTFQLSAERLRAFLTIKLFKNQDSMVSLDITSGDTPIFYCLYNPKCDGKLLKADLERCGLYKATYSCAIYCPDEYGISTAIMVSFLDKTGTQ